MLLIEWPILYKMIDDVEPHHQECCGFFFGHERANNRIITKTIVANNSEKINKRTNYKIDPMNYQYAELVAHQQNMKLLGVYHSHINKLAVPSEYDRIAAQPFFSYIIISVTNRKLFEVRSWQLNQQSRFEEVKIDLLPSSLKYHYGNSYNSNPFAQVH